MARVLAISSQVAWGPVGLTALVPPLQAKSHEVMALPTITLSNHPGHGRPQGFRTEAAQLAAILAALKERGALDKVDAVLTGYFASPEQVEEAARAIASLNAPIVLVDPVIGDGDALYVPEDVATAIRGHLLPLATIITPNAFELGWLSGIPVADEASAIAAAHSLGTPEVLATSVPHTEDFLLTLAITENAVTRLERQRLPHVPQGTGDFLSGAYLAERLSSPPERALPAAMQKLDRAIAMSHGTDVLAVAQALIG
ncbi:bifunctional hydroxymethylpyrimidine kinase/phosphomethylpyrimidine kinase [Aestuariivirga sp.]|uniref:bifunctional hydroxymethylpyrimidine kinase/phosphomethylpyrimidine kinase n=1 Tax=Aestuariivirga sp. TaxID=2650926 RepID=UPI0039E6E619